MPTQNLHNRLYTLTMLIAAILVATGVVVGDAMHEVIGLWWWLGGLCVAILVAVWTREERQTVCDVAIVCGVVLLGGMRVALSESDQQELNLPSEGVETGDEGGLKGISCECVVLSEPVIRGKTAQFDGYVTHSDRSFLNDGYDLEGKKVRISLLRDTITEHYKSIHLGTGLKVKADLSTLRERHHSGSNFSYLRWLRARGFVCRAFVPIGKWEQRDTDWGGLGVSQSVQLLALEGRQKILERLQRADMSADAYSIAVAMTLGEKSSVTHELREEYSVAGVSHILALSGTHLSVIYMLFMLFVRKHRRRDNLPVLLFIWGYAFMAGLPISVVRASLMLSIFHLSHMSGRIQNPFNVLGLTAVIMLLLSPESLWDVGFQMSFTAVASIYLFQPIIQEQMPPSLQRQPKKIERQQKASVVRRKRIGRKVWEMCGMTISAQIGTAPLTAYYFGRFTLYFLLANVVVLPVSTVVIGMMLCLVVLCVADMLSGGLLMIFVDGMAWIVSSVVSLLNWFVSAIAGLPGASIEDIDLNVWQVGLLYVMLGCVYRLCRMFLKPRM